MRKNKIQAILLIFLFSIGLANCGGGGGSYEASSSGVGTKWEKTFGGAGDDWGYSVQQTSDGGFIIAGSTNSMGSGFWDIYLIKTDSSGNKEWEKTFGGSGSDMANSVQQTSDGGYIITGFTAAIYDDNSDVYLIKADSSGNLVWEKTFGGAGWDVGNSVQQTMYGGYIIAGSTSSFGALYESDVYLIKTDSSGNEEWEKTFGGSEDEAGWSVQQTTDGGYIITGCTDSTANWLPDVYLVKTDSSGNEEWEKTFGGTDQDYGYSVQQTSDNGYVISGKTESMGAGYEDVYLIKTDSSGNLAWEKTFGGTGWEAGNSVQQTTDAGYIIAGYTAPPETGGDVYLVKTDSNGNKMWENAFGGTGDEVGYSVRQTSDTGYIITGSTRSMGAGGADVYLIKTDSFGNSK